MTLVSILRQKIIIVYMYVAGMGTQICLALKVCIVICRCIQSNQVMLKYFYFN